MLKRFIASIIDIILPRDELSKSLENMESHTFLKKVSRNIENRINVHSLFSYKDPLIKKAIWEIKYRNNRKIGKLIGEILCDELIEDISEKEQFENFTDPILIPIPLSKRRLRERGYNQTENIGIEMTKIDMSNSFQLRNDILYKIKDTLPQSSFKDKESRLQNLKGCFEVKDPQKIRGRNIILLDDVTTTGKTLEEARSACLTAGARSVFCITIAH